MIRSALLFALIGVALQAPVSPQGLSEGQYLPRAKRVADVRHWTGSYEWITDRKLIAFEGKNERSSFRAGFVDSAVEIDTVTGRRRPLAPFNRRWQTPERFMV